MHTSIRLGVAGLILAALAVVGWASVTLQAQLAVFQAQLAVYGGNSSKPGTSNSPTLFATAEEPPLDPVTTVHLASTPTAAQARTWLVLQKPLDMPFPNETPLEDVVTYIRRATTDPAAWPEGVPIYLDPMGLVEAEKTTGSPVQFDARGIPLASSLRMMLKQLGLGYTVNADGLVVVTSETSMAPTSEDASALMLDTLSKLSAEVSALRWEVAALRTGRAVAPAPAARGEGMGGSVFGGAMVGRMGIAPRLPR